MVQTEQNKVMYEDAEWVAYLSIGFRCGGREDERSRRPVVFLASDASEYINGKRCLWTANLDGGDARAAE